MEGNKRRRITTVITTTAYLTLRRLRGYSEAGSARVPAASSGAYGMVQPRSWLSGMQSLTLVQMLLDEGDAAIG